MNKFYTFQLISIKFLRAVKVIKRYIGLPGHTFVLDILWIIPLFVKKCRHV